MLNITRYGIKAERLVPWVKFIWQINIEQDDLHYELLPTDCIDVILNLADDIVYETDSANIYAPAFHINGLRSKHSLLHQKGKICIWGISFYSFGLYPFVHASLKESQDSILDLHTFSPSLAQKLKHIIFSGTTDKIVIEIESVLLEELFFNANDLEKTQLIREFLEVSENISVKSFCTEKFLSIKTFERTCIKYTGYTPKALANAKRFQNASNQLTHQATASLVDITYNNSFTDQSHLTKEFTRLSGMAPGTFQSTKATVKENAKYTYH